MAMVAVFVLVGIVVVQKSQAAMGCPFNNYDYDPGTVRPCVKEIQTMLNSIGSHYRYNGYAHLTVDGRYGTATVGQVQDFQFRTQGYYPEILGATGMVYKYPQDQGSWSTWRKLCSYYHYWNSSDYTYTYTGCGSVPLISNLRVWF
jgi:hypothetical protein